MNVGVTRLTIGIAGGYPSCTNQFTIKRDTNVWEVFAGGELPSELDELDGTLEVFPESIVRRRWPSAADYGDFLRRRKVDYVMIWGHYSRVFHTNDDQRLVDLETCLAGAPVCSHQLRHTDRWTLWAVRRGAPPAALR